MNKILNAVLRTVEVGVTATVPGAGIVDAAVHGVVDNKGSLVSIEQALDAGFQELETLKPESIADPATFNANIQIAIDAVHRAIAAVKTPSGQQVIK